MTERFTTMHVKPSALRILKMIAAATGEKIYEAFDRLLRAEAKRLGLPLEGGRHD